MVNLITADVAQVRVGIIPKEWRNKSATLQCNMPRDLRTHASLSHAKIEIVVRRDAPPLTATATLAAR